MFKSIPKFDGIKVITVNNSIDSITLMVGQLPVMFFAAGGVEMHIHGDMYDGTNQQKCTTTYEFSISTSWCRRYYTEYDIDGNVTYFKGSDGYEEWTTYENGREISSYDSEGAFTKYEYDENGMVISYENDSSYKEKYSKL